MMAVGNPSTSQYNQPSAQKQSSFSATLDPGAPSFNVPGDNTKVTLKPWTLDAVSDQAAAAAPLAFVFQTSELPDSNGVYTIEQFCALVIGATATFAGAAGAGGNRYLDIYLEGEGGRLNAPIARTTQPASVNAAETTVHAYYIGIFQPGDKISLCVAQDSGSSLEVLSGLSTTWAVNVLPRACRGDQPSS